MRGIHYFTQPHYPLRPMLPVTVNQIALAVFLFANLAVGWWAGRGVKSVRDYVLANQSLGLGVLSMTLAATLIEGDSIAMKSAYSRGLISLLPMLCLSVMAAVLGWFVFPRLTTFTDCYTVTDVMDTLYGDWGRKVTFLVSSLFSLLVMVAQLTAAGGMGRLLGVSPGMLILALGMLMTLYTCLGGIRAVAATDVLQFILLAIGVGVFGGLAITEAGGVRNILGHIPAESDLLRFWSHPHLAVRSLNAFFWSLFPTLLFAPPIIQRVLLTPRKRDIRQMFLSFSLLYPLLRGLLLLVAFRLLLRSDVPAVSQLNLGRIIELACTSRLGQVAFFLAAFAVWMSTYDSFLHALAILWTTDLVKPLMIRSGQAIDVVKWSRWSTLLLGLLSTFWAAYTTAPSTQILGYGVVVFSTITIPLLAGLLGLRGGTKAFSGGCITFLIVFLVFLGIGLNSDYLLFLKGDTGISGAVTDSFYVLRLAWLFAITASTLTFFALHYLENGGFVFVERESGRWQVQRSYHFCLPELAWLKSPVAWAESKVKQYGKEPYLVGMFIYLFSFFPYLTRDNSVAPLFVVFALRLVGVLLCTLLLTESLWPAAARRYLDLCYFLTLFHCLPFTHALTALSDPTGYFTVINIVLGIFLLALLVDWRTFLGMQLLGTLLALLVHKVGLQKDLPEPGLYGGLVLGFSVLYSLAVCLIFARKKQALTASCQACAQAESDLL